MLNLMPYQLDGLALLPIKKLFYGTWQLRFKIDSLFVLLTSHPLPTMLTTNEWLFFFPLCELPQFKCVKTLEPLEWEHEMSLMAERGPLCLCSTNGAGYGGSALLIWEVIFAQGTPPPLGWQKNFLRVAAITPK